MEVEAVEETIETTGSTREETEKEVGAEDANEAPPREGTVIEVSPSVTTHSTITDTNSHTQQTAPAENGPWYEHKSATYFDLQLPLKLDTTKDINTQIRKRLQDFVRIGQGYDPSFRMIKFGTLQKGTTLFDVLDSPDDVGTSMHAFSTYFRNCRLPAANHLMYLTVIIAMDTEPSQLNAGIAPYFDMFTQDYVEPGKLPPKMRFYRLALQADKIKVIGWILCTDRDTDTDYLSEYVNKYFARLQLKFGFRSAPTEMARKINRSPPNFTRSMCTPRKTIWKRPSKSYPPPW